MHALDDECGAAHPARLPRGSACCSQRPLRWTARPPGQAAPRSPSPPPARLRRRAARALACGARRSPPMTATDPPLPPQAAAPTAGADRRGRPRPARFRHHHRRAQPRRICRGPCARRHQSAGAIRRRTRPRRHHLQAGVGVRRAQDRRGAGGAQCRGASGRATCGPSRAAGGPGLLLARRPAVGVVRLDPRAGRLAGDAAGWRLQKLAAAGGGGGARYAGGTARGGARRLHRHQPRPRSCWRWRRRAGR